MPMYRVVIEKAKEEAETFIKSCDEALERIDKEKADWDQRYPAQDHHHGPQPSDHSWGSRETGSLRRKSMDLTRILADLRRR